MAYGYSANTPSYGYQTTQKKTPTSPYYRAATLGAGGEAKNQAPFTSLASGTASSPTVKPPAQGQGYLDAAGHPVNVTQAMIDKSLADNPNAAGSNGTPFAGSTTLTDPMATVQTVQYDYRTDPALQGILAQGVSSRQDAETNALAGKKHIALQYADAALGNLIGDSATAQAAQNNPYGVFNRIQTQQGLDTHNLDEQFNKGNLFYSGARELGQGQLADQYGAQRADATAAEQDALGAIDSNRLAQILAANQADNQGRGDAVNRGITVAGQNGWPIVGWNADGSPMYGQPSAATPQAPAAPAAPAGNELTASGGLTNSGPTGVFPGGFTPSSMGATIGGMAAANAPDALAMALAQANRKKQLRTPIG